MFCKHCGSKLPEDASFCVTCGKKITADTPCTPTLTDAESVFNYAVANASLDFDRTYTAEDLAAPQDEARDAHGGRILLFAILALAFSLSFYLAIVGTVFYIITKVELGKYLSEYGETEGRASVGKALSKAALPVNIVMMVSITLIIVALLLV